jgi:hypothetical protein
LIFKLLYKKGNQMTKKKSMAMSDFYTRSAHNSAKKMILLTPNGEETDEFMMILGSESDEARKAKNLALRDAAIHLAEKSLDEDVNEELTVRMLAAHIDSWSFNEELTINSAISFLTEAPYIRDQVDRFSGKNSVFFEKK